MTTLIAGASGATGKQVVNQLLKKKEKVKIIVRSTENLPDSWKNNKDVTIITESILNFNSEKLAEILRDCDAVVSCLGHNITWKGIYGQPRKLVTDAVRLLADSIKLNNPEVPTRFVLMNTTGNRNRDLNEKISVGQRMVISLLRLLLPPHVDNEKAADYLRTQIGQQDQTIEWVAVRPDGLIDEDEISDYKVFPSPIRSPIFNPGKTSRINVAHFMAELLTDDYLWKKWKGQMPVIYNESSVN